ncbi:barstar family protein [Streptomyces sp. NPDC055189]
MGTLEDFWQVIGEAINGPEGYFGKNLDAFADCLSGGFGTPDDDDYVVEWRDHQVSREHLSHAETARQLEMHLARCHPANRFPVRAELTEAREERGTRTRLGMLLLDRVSEWWSGWQWPLRCPGRW